jgi:DNA-binding NarL/FixJ family response regulator
MTAQDFDCLERGMASTSLDFYIDERDEEKRSALEIALHRLGCQTQLTEGRLHVCLPGHPAFEMLSTRELQLVCLASKGNTDKEIANTVGLSIYTVRSYWVRICHKLGAHNRTHAVSIVFANKVLPTVDPPPTPGH